MRLDFQADPDAAARIVRAFVIYDLDADKPLDVPVWYADEDTGACRAYAFKIDDTPESRRIDPATKRPPSVEFTRDIAFLPRPGREAEAKALRHRLSIAAEAAE